MKSISEHLLDVEHSTSELMELCRQKGIPPQAHLRHIQSSIEMLNKSIQASIRYYSNVYNNEEEYLQELESIWEGFYDATDCQ